jgi:hypothetical protein
MFVFLKKKDKLTLAKASLLIILTLLIHYFFKLKSNHNNFFSEGILEILESLCALIFSLIEGVRLK